MSLKLLPRWVKLLMLWELREEWVDPRRAASYLEDKLPQRDRLLVFDGGHSAMVTCQALSSPSADNWSLGLDFGAIGKA